MSLLWRDRLHAVLSPHRVVLVRLGKGLKARVVAKELVQVAEPAAGASPWQAAVDALGLALPHRQWKHADVRVILSNHFVHYLTVPWQEKVGNEEELAALVRYSFTEIYGEAVADWDLRWSEGRPPAPVLAAAVDRRLLDGVQEACRTAGLRLIAAEPYLMAAFNRWRGDLDGRRDWFLLAETGRLCLAWFRDEEWVGVNSQQIGPDWGAELPQILERVLLLAGQNEAPERLAISAPEVPSGQLVLADGWSGSLLQPGACPGFVPAQDSAYAMAMNA